MAIPSITPLPAAPSRSSSPTTFSQDADALLGALPAMVTEINAANAAIPATVLGIDFTGTSTTSLAVGTGSKTLTTQSGKNWYVGQAVRISNTATPANYMDGQVTSYSGTSLVVSVGSVGGSGTFTAWTIGPAISGSSYATLTGVETLTNKTLTAPVLSASASGTTVGAIGYSGGVLTFGDGTTQQTIATTSSTQTLTNKTLTGCPISGASVSGTTGSFSSAVQAANFVVPASGYIRSPYDGGTDTGTARAGLLFDGTNQVLTFYTANTNRGSFKANGDFVLTGSNFGFGESNPSSAGGNQNFVFTGSGNVTISKAATTATGASAQARFDLVTGTANAYGISAMNDNTGSPYWSVTTGSAVGYVQFVCNTNGVRLSSGGTSWSAVSDLNRKDIIEPITEAVAKVDGLRAVIGKYKGEAVGTRRAFLIAQDVQAVLPEAISTAQDGTLMLSYTETIPLLVAAIKELSARVAALEA